MLRPLIRRPKRAAEPRSRERGFTMALVALAMATIICVAALSIDLGTLYEAKAEAQRAADAAALTAARVISASGVTGTTQASWGQICGGAASPATLAAISMAQQNLISGAAVASGAVNVKYGAGSAGATNADCSTLGATFAVNPIVAVSLQRTNLPIFFARIFSLFGSNYAGSTVSATATAEVFNPSGSIPLVPVHPRCVKPWFVPNLDPEHPGFSFVSATTGQIQKAGTSPTGVIGETFTLVPDCGTGASCAIPTDNPPVENGSGGGNTLDYVPGLISTTSIAIAANSSISACSDATTNDYTEAVAGCDQTTAYACGSSLANTIDLTENPGPPRNDSVNGAQCLINASGNGPAVGQDVLVPGAAPYTYPFQIQTGANSALISAGVASGSQISSSPSIVSLPIFDTVASLTSPTTPVTVIGFLQVFINNATGTATTGPINVTVMNVAGCGNSVPGPPIAVGTSPVPIRLITPP